MKLVIFFSLLVLGLVSANVLDNLDLEFDLKDMTVDKAKGNLRVLHAVNNLIDQSEKYHGGFLKMSLRSIFDHFKQSVEAAINKIEHYLKNVIEDAKDYFEKIIKNLHFDDVLKKMLPYVNDEMTVATCTITCEGIALFLFGPEAKAAEIVCEPLCKAALAELEQHH